MDESAERELRQFRLMDRCLRDFLAGQKSIGTTLNDLRGLLSALEETSDDWIWRFKEEWNVLEVEYATALDAGDSLPDHSAPLIRDSAERMLAMVQERTDGLAEAGT